MPVKFTIVVFLLVATLILVIGHFGLYGAWVKFFGIAGSKAKAVLLVSLLALSVSFIATTLLVHWRENALTEWLYIIFSGWLGFAWYFALAALVTLLTVPLVRLGIPSFPWWPIAAGTMVIAAGVTIWGLWNAQHPRVVNVTMKLPNAPASWQGRTIVQLSDIHLGVVHHRRFAEKVAKQVNELKPDIVFITGDTFDGVGRKLAHLAEPLSTIASPLGTYAITGNHEMFLGMERSLAALRDLDLTILRDEIVDVDGVQVLGLEYPNFGEKKDIVPLLNQLDRNRPSIALIHEPTVRWIEQAKAAGVDIQLSGHTHHGQLWPFEFITRRVYKGYDGGLVTKDGYQLYVSPGVGSWGPPIRTGNRPAIVRITIE